MTLSLLRFLLSFEDFLLSLLGLFHNFLFSFFSLRFAPVAALLGFLSLRNLFNFFLNFLHLFRCFFGLPFNLFEDLLSFLFRLMTFSLLDFFSWLSEFFS